MGDLTSPIRRRPHRRPPRAVLTVVLAVIPLSLSGCAAVAPTPRERALAAVDAFCEDLGALRMDAGRLAGLSPRSKGRDELRDLREDVAHDVDLVAGSVRAVRKARARARVRAVSQAYDRVSRAIDELPSAATGAEAAQRIRPHLEALDQAVAASQAAVKC
ncbi:hypothetical protein E2C00_19280 [Streptomyces sp. WAC05374]|uniref:hypothetical protein n=1 Tax=Streptomyces sp. WAC05374 TaxID=2487420 RepID=UPI000F85DE3A|nr:hypothetical protein [Streptomyces sp. WAC05374]RST17706.1 hypothetical protein EF905_08525 [Streptomyces sp. WAC05374]TDF52707.1 hypothetical protein E2C02_20750 [Streptomyces sp. WAC05374]TDF54126.1 hypothetical protein E2C00_19280 [Streptomyces sp. WAC05374]